MERKKRYIPQLEKQNPLLDRLQIRAEHESQFNSKNHLPELSVTSALWEL
jgi:hypothetical protein